MGSRSEIRGYGRPKDQRYATYLGSLFAIGMEALQDRDAVPDPAKLYFTGRLSSQTRNAEGLEAILRSIFIFRRRFSHLQAAGLRCRKTVFAVWGRRRRAEVSA